MGDGEGDCSSWVDGCRKAQREEAVRFVEDEASYVGDVCCNGWSVWVRGRGLARSQRSTLGTWEGRRPLFVTCTYVPVMVHRSGQCRISYV